MSDQQNCEKTKYKLTSNWDKYAYTVIICLNQIAFGMTISMFGPVMVDMKHILKTSMKSIALYPTFISLGYLIGSLFGFLFKYLNRQISSIIVLILMSVSSIFIPRSPELWALYLCALIVGLGSGLWSNVINVWLIEMWQQNSPPLLQLSQFMYGIGTIFGPLIDRPYLTGEDIDSNVNQTKILNDMKSDPIIEDIDLRRAQIKIPFLISGLIQMTFPILLALMYAIKRYRIAEINERPTESANIEIKLFDRNQSPRKLMIALIAIYLAIYNASEMTFLNFGSTYYQYFALRLTASKSAEIISLMATSYTIGRGISVFIAIKTKPQHMITYHFILLIIALVILMFTKSMALLWIASILIGFGFSAIVPAIFAFFRQYIAITDRIGAILTFSCASINLISPFILGQFIEENPIIFMYFEFSYILVSVLLFCLLIFIIRNIEKYNNSNHFIDF